MPAPTCSVVSWSQDEKSEHTHFGSSSLRRTQGSFVARLGSREHRFFTLAWAQAEAEPTTHRGLVFLCHGMAEYLNPGYDRLGLLLASHGFLAFGHDHLGHGRTSGTKVQLENGYESDLVDPVLEHCQHYKEKFPELPLFIVGHSMGGAVSLLTILKAKEMNDEIFRGAVIMGGMLKVDPALATPFYKALTRLLSSVLPWLAVSEIKTEHLTRDKAEMDRITSDQLVWHGGVRLRFAFHSMKIMEELENRSAEITVPMLIQHGDKDMICCKEGSEDLFKNVGSDDKELKLYPGAYHSMYLEIPETRDVVMNDTIDWIKARV